MTATPYTVWPHASADAQGFTGRQVARAYGWPIDHYSGAGYTCGIVELGGGFGAADLRAYFGDLGIPVPHTVAVGVDGGRNSSDGPNGADGEVLLDIEVAGAVAPGASFRVYFAPNTNDGFLAAINQAVHECDVVSISWGGPESSWDLRTATAFDHAFAVARAAGVPVFVAAGDSGSRDGTGANTVDFPASSPNVVGCGGTRLSVNADGTRAAEVVWDDNDTSSATGGGVSRFFAGRQVPDVAGNADPQTGYDVEVDGGAYVIGGTSAVAPLMAGLHLLALEATGGKRFDWLGVLAAHPEVCWDVTQGDNGGYRAGPGRDDCTGLGVVDGAKLLAVLGVDVPAPLPVPPPAPEPTPPPAPTPVPPIPVPPKPVLPPAAVDSWAERVITHLHYSHQDRVAAQDYLDWRAQQTG